MSQNEYGTPATRVVAGVPERGVPECRSGVWVPPGPGGSHPGQFLAPETQHDIGGVGDALGMRHHDHAFAELMGGVLQQMNHTSSVIFGSRLPVGSSARIARPGATSARPTATR